MKKKLLSCLITICMIVAICPYVSKAESNEKPKLLTVNLWNTALYELEPGGVNVSKAVSEISNEGVTNLLQGTYFLDFSVYQDDQYRIKSFKHNDSFITEDDMRNKMTEQNISDNPLWTAHRKI